MHFSSQSALQLEENIHEVVKKAPDYLAAQSSGIVKTLQK